ncbi:hypothetical protein ONS95_006916 [Cadophora gregata]|uniref:uncharacterized protein n=1 Tax=Cadophora gregata TaxID=51156 RepID=UPI0026DB0499|nr:uncharacterized protein ONS95_006916 [Cadophora gregata]KAK0101763.1 hypothetical protein ONS95_006916 [Cadophora gregata]KAK0106221.1 hypothetical protein ONS96_003864 [Cadophora gregata f. sp. sojae]
MASEAEPEIILYDLACIKNVCFSPIVWRIRMILNYKKVPYRTIFLEFPDIEPTLKGLGIPPSTSTPPILYTVPAITHLPTNTHLMDSLPIAEFLTTTYPSPPLPLTSPLGTQIQSIARSLLSSTFRASLLPREIHILSPKSQDYFRRTREATLGHRMEELLEGEKEEKAWEESKEGWKEVGELLLTNREKGGFVLGEVPSYADFFVAGALQCARVVDEGTFERMVGVKGFKEIYDACEPWLERKD